jgi:hypothetical protein
MPQSPSNQTVKDKPEAKILFQRYFKSVGPRTYAAQVKEASNGNHFLVLIEGKRDKKTDEVRKTSLLVFSEDFEAFAKLFADANAFIKANPVSPEVAQRQREYWSKPRGNRNGKSAPRNASQQPRRPMAAAR